MKLAIELLTSFILNTYIAFSVMSFISWDMEWFMKIGDWLWEDRFVFLIFFIASFITIQLAVVSPINKKLKERG